LQGYLKMGRGFHSNDTRVVVAQEGREILPAAYGLDLGGIWKPTTRIFLNAAYWILHLDQEFVYVGDEGVVEPSGQTIRHGVELSSRVQLTPALFFNLDANYTDARAVNAGDGGDRIPLAPNFVLQSGLSYSQQSGPYGGLSVRYLADRPANEDNSIVAEGYAVVDMNAGYNFGNFDIGIQIQNLLGTNWNETQFATESRLFNEANSVEEIHFTPGTPFFLKGVVQMRF